MGNVHGWSFVGGMALGIVFWLVAWYTIPPLIANGRIDWDLLTCKLRTWDYECERKTVDKTPTTEDVVQRAVDGWITMLLYTGQICEEAKVDTEKAIYPIFIEIINELLSQGSTQADIMKQLDELDALDEEEAAGYDVQGDVPLPIGAAIENRKAALDTAIIGPNKLCNQ